MGSIASAAALELSVSSCIARHHVRRLSMMTHAGRMRGQERRELARFRYHARPRHEDALSVRIEVAQGQHPRARVIVTDD